MPDSSQDPIEIRVAVSDDIGEMTRIRNAVKENPLVRTVIGPEDYRRAMHEDGRAWVAFVGEEMAGFSCVRTVQGDIWALFMDERYEGRGIGRRLLDEATEWAFGEGLPRIRLTTGTDTRAERLYRVWGWTEEAELSPSGERCFFLDAPSSDDGESKSET